MHRNLRAEMAREGITMVDIADYLKVRYATINDKVNGKYDFSYTEALKIKRHFFPNLNIEYLFENDEQSIKKKESRIS
ncbi:DNA-binding protein [Heyndrickxia sporothermodurans]|uniref:helix-turn-helix transcriptional regulator n=1 Tax=Heyndrickxia sporothermodurans TaxID=46224 RepID=UPI000D340010|nr:helix-turn-helix transcriptional regulator [Heyndrickxia sporothermodurans]PTY76207.1 DNA-binding protein [Heyndrickxia sporothermodurans]